MATEKQQKAFKKVVEGSSIANAMREVGYSPETAKRTNKLTNSKGWGELMETYLPDDFLAKIHKEGLEATKQDKLGEIADYPTRHKYLDTAYKIKGKVVDKSMRVNVDIAKVLDELEDGS